MDKHEIHKIEKRLPVSWSSKLLQNYSKWINQLIKRKHKKSAQILHELYSDSQKSEGNILSFKVVSVISLFSLEDHAFVQI